MSADDDKATGGAMLVILRATTTMALLKIPMALADKVPSMAEQLTGERMVLPLLHQRTRPQRRQEMSRMLPQAQAPRQTLRSLVRAPREVLARICG